MIALFAWSPWVQPTEEEWLGTYVAWSDDVEASIAAGRSVRRSTCEAGYDEAVGAPPTERLDGVAAAARNGCAAPSRPGWKRARTEVVHALLLAHSQPLPPRRRADFSEIARTAAGVRPRVYCWRPEAWSSFAPQYALLRAGEETSLKGIADPARERIDLDPGICQILGKYGRDIRPSALSYENFELAEALSVLTHQATHVANPSLSEVDVECGAVQHVRPLVLAAGWGAPFANEIALHAWEISYTQLPPQFRTPDCRNGGRLDRHPASSAWP